MVDKSPKQITMLRKDTENRLRGLVGENEIKVIYDSYGRPDVYSTSSYPNIYPSSIWLDPNREEGDTYSYINFECVGNYYIGCNIQDNYYTFATSDYAVNLPIVGDGIIAVMASSIDTYTIEIDSDIGNDDYMHIITTIITPVTIILPIDLIEVIYHKYTYLPCSGCCTINGEKHMVIGIIATSPNKWQLIYGTDFTFTDEYNARDILGLDIVKKIPLFLGE